MPRYTPNDFSGAFYQVMASGSRRGPSPSDGAGIFAVSPFMACILDAVAKGIDAAALRSLKNRLVLLSAAKVSQRDYLFDCTFDRDLANDFVARKNSRVVF